LITSETWCAIQALNSEYWRRVDRTSDEAVADLYVEHGRMQIGTLDVHGRGAIADFFAHRNAQERANDRTTRHLASNVLVELQREDRCRVLSTVAVMAGFGDWPMTSQPPSTVGDFEDVVVRGADGIWRYEKRYARICFSGANAASFAR